MNTEHKKLNLECATAQPIDQTRTETGNRVTRNEARDAIMLQLRKWREEGQDHIYFGALNIAPDLDEELTFGHLIDIVFDNFFPSVAVRENQASTLTPKQENK